MSEVIEALGRAGLVPVIKVSRAEDALPLGRALSDGGLPVAEITFRTAAAAEAIRRLTRELPTMLVGAGTVLNVGQAAEAVEAGCPLHCNARTRPGYCWLVPGARGGGAAGRGYGH